MFCLIQCANELVFQEICDQLIDMKILYLAEAPKLEIQVKSEPRFIARLLRDHGYNAKLLVHS